MEVRAGLAVVTAGVLAGELAGAWWRPPLLVLVAALGTPAILAFAGVRCRYALAWATVALAALALGALRMRVVTEPSLPSDDVARLGLPLRTTLTGVIAAAPGRRAGRTIVLVRAESIGRGAHRHPASGLVRLSIRHARRHWRYGERLEAETLLRRPRNFDDPGSFDWVGHLARQGVRVIASVWDGGSITRLAHRARGPRAWLERWRLRLGIAIRAAVRAPEGPVLRALVIGDEDGVDPALREAFTRAGVVHVLSISGLHVGLVAAGAFAVARWLLARSERLLLGVDIERVAALLSLGPVVVYGALAGFAVATLRSVVMVGIGVLAAVIGRRVDVLRGLGVAALALALVLPGAPLDIGFQLSFVSVAAIVCGVRRLLPEAGGSTSWATRLGAAALVSPCALLGTAPLTAFHFHQVSLVGLIANPLAVPIFGSAVVGLGLTGALLELLAPGAAALLFRGAGIVLRPGIALVCRLGAPAWAALEVPIPTLFELGLAYAVLGGLLLLPHRGGRALLAAGLAGMVADAGWWAHQRSATGVLRVTFVDVGQGDAAVAELPDGQVLVIDAGGLPGGAFDTGAAVLSPFLHTRKIGRVDALAMTHAHPDHCGGLAYLLAHHAPREFWWTGLAGEGPTWDRLSAAIGASGARVRILADGVALPPSAPEAVVLHPPPHPSHLSLNDSSLTLRLVLDAASVLLTGDIEARAEERLLHDPARLRSTVLKVPHHGSRTSSSQAFLDAVAPLIAVMSVGVDNRYNLPSREVERRYLARGTCLLRTDRCGAVTIETDGHTLRTWARQPGPQCTCAPISLGRSSDAPEGRGRIQ